MSRIVVAFLEGEPPVFFLESPPGALARTRIVAANAIAR